ncbi:hypothetical protein [Paraburkholderia sp. BCC1884]|uniref:hypothetical protein n=1 Tax=Paraburkholderia sp. BCC1884 TaxID=2562668 RepID=UPI0021B39A6C|nr:hypothetical protein [Paraburkholderia sp. BCC1884]
MRGAAREAEFWRLLTRVRGVRVRRRLRGLADARRRERQAADAVARQFEALEQHAQRRSSVLAWCRRDVRARAQWHATLRGHDALMPGLQRLLSEARHLHAAAREAAGEALRAWQIEQARHDDAKDRWRAAVARRRALSIEH